MTLKQANGYTFIELIITVAVLAGIVMYVAPTILNTATTTRSSALIALAGALNAANASNYAVRKLDSTLGVSINNCTDLADTVPGVIPPEYKIISSTAPVDISVTCTLSGPNSASALFTATGIT